MEIIAGFVIFAFAVIFAALPVYACVQAATPAGRAKRRKIRAGLYERNPVKFARFRDEYYAEQFSVMNTKQ